MYWKAVSINDCSSKSSRKFDMWMNAETFTDAIRQYLSPNAEEVVKICAQCGVKVTTGGRLITQGFSPPEGVKPLYLRVEVKFSMNKSNSIVTS